MRVIITGGTGLIGRRLCRLLGGEGHEVIVLTRDPGRAGAAAGLPPGVRLHGWDARGGEGWADLITADSAVVNLAGENPSGAKWTADFKRRMLQSRLDATAAVLAALAAAGREGRGPRAWLQASAVGYYGDRGDEVLTEDSTPGGGFRAEVCRRWEEEAAAGAREVSVRAVLLRIGIVLGPGGGAWPELLNASGKMVRRLGDGRQWVPWVHEDDVAAAVRFLMAGEAGEGLSGPVNLVAPEPVTNARLMRVIADARRRPALLPVPAAVLRAVFGERAEAVLDSQRAVPRRLEEAGFGFRYPRAGEAVAELLERPSAS